MKGGFTDAHQVHSIQLIFVQPRITEEAASKGLTESRMNLDCPE